MTKQHIKDPGSAITHFIGMLMAIFAAVPLLIRAAHEPGRIYVISLAIYAASLVLLYAASTTYHTKKGCEFIAHKLTGQKGGILIKAFWVFCPKWVSSILYIGMGWTCVLAFTQLLNSMSMAAFGWLLAGGIIYTIGGVIYALKLPIFNSRHQNFGSHEIFHLFVMGGSACHFVVMYAYLLP